MPTNYTTLPANRLLLCVAGWLARMITLSSPSIGTRYVQFLTPHQTWRCFSVEGVRLQRPYGNKAISAVLAACVLEGKNSLYTRNPALFCSRYEGQTRPEFPLCMVALATTAVNHPALFFIWVTDILHRFRSFFKNGSMVNLNRSSSFAKHPTVPSMTIMLVRLELLRRSVQRCSQN